MERRAGRHARKAPASGTSKKSKAGNGRRRFRWQADANIWASPPDKNFPRAHLWDWGNEGGFKGESSGHNTTTFEQEFEAATSIRIGGDIDGTLITDSVSARDKHKGLVKPISPKHKTGHCESINQKKIRHYDGLRERRASIGTMNKSKSAAVSAKAGAAAAAAATASSRIGTSKLDVRGAKAQDNTRTKEEDKVLSSDVIELRGNNSDATESSHGKEEKEQEQEQEREQGPERFRTPTPLSMMFGLDDNCENPDGDPHEMLVAKLEREKNEISPLDAFLEGCSEDRVLPEPLLNARRTGVRETIEASKRQQNLLIVCKSDVERANDLVSTITDWEAVSKLPAPDELKLAHYGMGDHFMGAMAKGLVKDAANARSGKRCFQRFNFAACRITGRGLKRLIEGFVHHPNARKLDLSHNRLGPDGIAPLHSIFQANIPANQSLCSLNLSANNIGDRAIIGLFEALKQSSIRWLDLSQNNISASGAVAIEQFILWQRSAQQLSAQNLRRERREQQLRAQQDFDQALERAMQAGQDSGISEEEEEDGNKSDEDRPTTSQFLEHDFFGASQLETPSFGVQQSPRKQSFVQVPQKPEAMASTCVGDEAASSLSQLEEKRKQRPMVEDEERVDRRWHDSALESLILDWNQIRGQYASGLIRAFENNQVITELSLSWNGFGTHKSSTAAILSLIEANSSIRLLRLGHNLFKKETCEAILRKLPESKSLMSLDLSGNDLHENIFDPQVLDQGQCKVSEGWPSQSNDLSGTSFIYTRYAVDPRETCKDSASEVAEDQTQPSYKNVSPKAPTTFRSSGTGFGRTMTRKGDLAHSTTGSGHRAGALDSSLDDCLDAYIWKRRGQCWIRHRWKKHTVTYYPGISGPPSREVFLLALLPDGSSACTRMMFEPSKQACLGTFRPTKKDMSGATSRSILQSTGSNLSTLSNMSRNTGLFLRTKQSTKNMLDIGRKIGEGNKAPASKQEAIFDPLGARKRRSKRQSLSYRGECKKPNRYDYEPILKRVDEDGTLGFALRDRLDLEANMPAEDDEIPESISNLNDLSMTMSEPICPCSVTLMLPPGRTQYRFLVRGTDIFARDQSTCWSKWPLQQHKVDISKLGSSNKEMPSGRNILKDNVEAATQRHSHVANFVDIKWSAYPVSGLANPDPGSERPQPASLWTPQKSMFRSHRCDDAKSLARVFALDWSKIEANSVISRILDDEKDSVRELLWANFAFLCTVFSIEAVKGGNAFAITPARLIEWLREIGIANTGVTDALLYGLVEETCTADLRANAGRDPLAKHAQFVEQEDCALAARIAAQAAAKEEKAQLKAEKRREHANLVGSNPWDDEDKSSSSSSEEDDDQLDGAHEHMISRHQFLIFILHAAKKIVMHNPGQQTLARTRAPSLQQIATLGKTKTNMLGKNDAASQSSTNKPNARSDSSAFLLSSLDHKKSFTSSPASPSTQPASSLASPRKRSLLEVASAEQGGSQRSTKGGAPLYETMFDSTHHFLRCIFLGREREYAHREVFRRGSLMFQDVVNVFLRREDLVRKLFEQHAVKGHVLHDFIPANKVEAVFSKVSQTLPRASLLRCFALCKCTFETFEDQHFAPGLCFLEFLECLVRVANERRLATSFVKAFSTKAAGVSDGEDELAHCVDKLLIALTKPGPSPNN